ncbi:hypothetical protein BKA69DRAFT_1144424 [Paraphysoderma sedebokerense]|nr:hypothetical protein BKA69DRAFT_1144424 [Paraphysoderma sedebokerense]
MFSVCTAKFLVLVFTVVCSFVGASPVLSDVAHAGSSNQTAHFVKRTDTADKVLIGYHGTCSTYQNGIEERIKLSPSQFELSTLGHRFYTSNSKSAAVIHAMTACAFYNERDPRRRLFKMFAPVVCPIYMDTNALKTLPKIFIPGSIPDDRGNPFILWGVDESKEHIENLANLDHRRTVRFTLNSVPQISFAKAPEKDVEAAWPEFALEHMSTKCNPVPKSQDPADDVTGYVELLKASQIGNDDLPEWGRPIFGAELYNPKSSDVETRNNKYTKMLEEEPRREKQSFEK